MRISFLLLLAGLLSFYSCQNEGLFAKEEPISTPTFTNVDDRLVSYFVSFEKEAAHRDLTLDLDQLGIIGQIINIEDEGVAGTCRYGDHFTNEVSVDENYWRNASNLRREFVVFHELGHCVLLRDHLEDSNSRGLCVSIMRSGLGDCIDAYYLTNRTAYLDELFRQDI